MAPELSKPQTPPNTPSLRDQACQQIMSLLEMANKSPHPEIRAAAVELANKEEDHLHRHEARLSPNVAYLCCVLICVLVAAACWYTRLHYLPGVSREINVFLIALGFLAILIGLALAGVIPATAVVDHMKAVWEEYKGKGGSSL